MSSNIYYHFFDRELRQSIDASLTDSQLLEVISASIFMTDQYFYMPISHLYESYFDYPNSLKFIIKMDKMGLIHLASSHESVENFLLSRQYLYQHDKERYPMYFGQDFNIWGNNVLYLNDSTTEILKGKFLSSKIQIPEFSEGNKALLKKIISSTVADSDSKAVTFSLFRNALNKNNLSSAELKMTQKYIKKSVSIHYTTRYLEVGTGTIITGVTQLKDYDFLADNKYETNFLIYSHILKTVGINICTETGLDTILRVRQDFNVFPYVYKRINELVLCVGCLVDNMTIGKMQRIMNYLYSPINFEEIASSNDLLKNLHAYIADISGRWKELKEKMNNLSEKEKSIVILAVTDVEMKELLNAINKYCPQVAVQEKYSSDLVYRELVGSKLPVYIVQSQMGLTGMGSVINTMHKVCNNLNPGKVIMGGIAFGSDKEKQKIGDILVSKQVWNYEPSKIKSEETISRGDKVPASSFLMQLFQSSKIDYKENDAQIYFGLLASGEKLVNSKEFLESLRNQETEVIGGEMEAAGLASVCNEKNIEWIVAKAICDWGYEKDDNGQQLAAHNAFDFIMYNLKKIIL
ncbi:MAG: 5'-methylthioadenosine/S-adenosylhomocysteine nucleosidase [Clostridiaceae bacterium]|nr:5'-methylthioadenosine/S-adenosylhomocysteine nucleosidase [Clostridiaceae bacterium]